MSAAIPDSPITLVGWSFGADMALGVSDARLAGWIAIAPPLRFRSTFVAATDPRPKHLVLAEHDEYRDPTEVTSEVADWTGTTVAVIPGASHFFVGRTDRVVSETLAGVARLATL
jgi:alpha/beta superfamily hydrolase